VFFIGLTDRDGIATNNSVLVTTAHGSISWSRHSPASASKSSKTPRRFYSKARPLRQLTVENVNADDPLE
jgi:hypothetical protein